MKTFKVISLILIVGLLVGKPITSASDSDCSPSAVPVWELGCYTWWAEPNKVYECQQNPEECCGTTLEEHCQKCTCSDGTVIVDSKLTGATCEDLCYYYDHQIKMPDLFQSYATCSPSAVPVWELGCYTWWAEPNKVYECQQNPEECCGTTLEEHCQKCTCSDGTVIVDSKLTGATCEDLCYYYDHQIKMPDLFQ